MAWVGGVSGLTVTALHFLKSKPESKSDVIMYVSKEVMEALEEE